MTLMVPTVFFLAGSAAAAPTTSWERAGLGLTAGAAVLLLGTLRHRSRLRRLLLVALVLLAASPFMIVRCVDRAYELEDRAFRRMEPEALAAAPSALLITADVAGRGAHLFPPERWVVPGGILASSSRRDPSMASLLTGEPVIRHRVFFDGDQGDPRMTSLGVALSLAGFETRIHGGEALPGWALRGVESADGGVVEACRWIAARGGAPRFAHVHVDSIDPGAIDAATRGLAPADVVVVASLTGAPEPDGVPGTFLDPGSLQVLLAVRVGPGAFAAMEERPRSLCEAHESIVRAIEQDRAPPRPLSSGERTALGDRVPGADVLVVSLAHGTDGWPHRIHARFTGATLDLEITPLGEHPTDDWELEGPTQEHVAYRNVVRVTPEERTPDIPELIARLARWRRKHGALEWRHEDPGAR